MKKFCFLILFCILSLFSFSSCDYKHEAREETYKVISVMRYPKPITNGFGGVIRTDIVYNFSYINNKGELISISDFKDSNGNGLHNVEISNADCDYVYIRDRGLYIYTTLFLTLETFKRL